MTKDYLIKQLPEVKAEIEQESRQQVLEIEDSRDKGYHFKIKVIDDKAPFLYLFDDVYAVNFEERTISGFASWVRFKATIKGPNS